MTEEPGPPLQSPMNPGVAFRERTLTDLFVALADTLVADFDVVELLDRLVNTCVEVFDVTAAGVLILNAQGQMRLGASSDHNAEKLEIYQVQTAEGPCMDCARGLTSISVPDLRSQQERWPRFTRAAETIGYQAVHALPLRLRSEGIGGFNLFHREPTVMSARDLHTIQALADVATIGILQQQHALNAAMLAGQLQGALDSRISVEQAKGILVEAGDMTPEAAFLILRRFSRDNNLKLSQVAHSLVSRELRPAAMIAAVRRQPR